jgi:DNA-binding transcriptional LysR family regulator
MAARLPGAGVLFPFGGGVIPTLAERRYIEPCSTDLRKCRIGAVFDWNDIRCFLAVARAGSTLGGGKALGVNQTTVARRLEALERALGLKLFERLQSGSRMTEAARALMPAAEALERSAQSLKAQAAAHARGLAGLVRVTTNEPLANIAIMPALPEFQRLFPDIQVQVIVSDAHLDLWKGEADVAFRGTAKVEDPDLVARRVADAPWAIYVSRGYAERHGRPARPESLAEHMLVGGDERVGEIEAVKWMMDQAPGAKARCLCNTLSNLHQAVRAGLGCGPLPRLMGAADPELLACMPAPGSHGIFMVTTPALRDAPRVRAFLDFMSPNVQAKLRALNETVRT